MAGRGSLRCCGYGITAWNLIQMVDAALQPLFGKIPGLSGIFVASSDGGCLLRVLPTGSTAGSSGVEPRAVSAFAFACAQARSIDFGALRTVTAFYERSVLLHIAAGFESSLVVTLAADIDTDTASMHALVPAITELFAALSPDGLVQT